MKTRWDLTFIAVGGMLIGCALVQRWPDMWPWPDWVQGVIGLVFWAGGMWPHMQEH